MTERPLHVRVAEALGFAVRLAWEDEWLQGREFADEGEWVVPAVRNKHNSYRVPRYDTDWAATGPLIERFEIALQEDGCGYTAEERWLARADYYAADPSDKEYGGHWAEAESRGATPLIAVCNLILALKEVGEL